MVTTFALSPSVRQVRVTIKRAVAVGACLRETEQGLGRAPLRALLDQRLAKRGNRLAVAGLAREYQEIGRDLVRRDQAAGKGAIPNRV